MIWLWPRSQEPEGEDDQEGTRGTRSPVPGTSLGVTSLGRTMFTGLSCRWWAGTRGPGRGSLDPRLAGGRSPVCGGKGEGYLGAGESGATGGRCENPFLSVNDQPPRAATDRIRLTSNRPRRHLHLLAVPMLLEGSGEGPLQPRPVLPAEGKGGTTSRRSVGEPGGGS